ncbi:transcription elongation factor B polypeptide 3 [Bactrocera dorsalis]|uniref:Transcription elongation factor B polypeptide 3 n=1 Tax=Bactrocera dorsalis TaxID=27457 RepID=A0A6I9VMC3_BACDO|nr:transcription elongation factor B polypeptide 3 [Bactrocera dorsalis]
MSSTSILGVIQHYQRSIEHSQDDEGRLLHCINKLYKLPVKVEHLQETGVGKTVNSLRKYNGEIGIAAKALVTKWKAMVAAEEEPAEVSNCQGNDDDDDMNNANGHGSSDDDRHNHSRKTSPQEHTHSNTLSENTPKERQNKHRDKGNSEHKSKSHNETHKHEISTTKRKRDVEQEQKEVSAVKKSKHEDRRNEGKNRENDRHKLSDEKSTRHHEHGEKHSSNRDTKTTSSSTTHHKNGGDSKEKRESLKGAKLNEHTSSSRRETNSSSEKTSKQDENEKHRSSKDKDRHERSKESKNDKGKSSSKDTSHRDKHHNSSTSHSSNVSSKPSTSATEQVATSSSSHAKGESRNNSRKRQLDSDSNDSTPTKTKGPKTPKATKQKAPIHNDNEEEVDADDGIDSSMGANFADVLGMLNMPTKKAKKSLNTSKSPTASTSSKSTSNDKPSGSSSSSKNARSEYIPTPISSASTSAKPVDKKPDLLSASAKLAPLDPSIALELPTISANYKPLPHNKTVMDCIYRNSGAVLPTPKPVRTLTDAEALSHGISSKTMRTKIYSGVKTGQVLQVPSLFDLCIRVLQKNIDGLEYTGGVPFDVLRPVLDRATPQQLLTFEEYNPYLMEDSDCLWQIHVQRNYRSKKRLEMESWREMYLRCEEEKEQKLNSLTATIKQSQKIIAAPVRKTQLAFVDLMVKPPRSVMRKQEQFGTKAKLVATPAARVAALSNVTPNAGKVGDTRLRVAATVRDAAQVSHAPMRAKKAPLMAKTLQFMRGRHKR